METEWKIFYDNKESFSSEDGSPEEAPTNDVLLIVQKGDHIQEGEHILNGGEGYRFFEGKWQQGYNIENWAKPFLLGKLVNQKTWRQAKQDAINYAKL